MSIASHYNQPRDFHIETQNLISATNVYQYKGGQGRAPIDRLLDHVAIGAAHNSAERGTDAPKCLPETRIAVQQEIMGWIEHGDRDGEQQRILWLSGPAGSGKTAITGSIADECHEKGWLAGSFFFFAASVSPDRRTKNNVITTLAYQLLEQDRLGILKNEILASIDNNPAIFGKRLDEQLQVLILEPLRKAGKMGYIVTRPKVIIVDGLDECDINHNVPAWASWRPNPLFTRSSTRGVRQEDLPVPKSLQEKEHLEILSALQKASTSSDFPGAFPFRIIIASRPETAIHEFFSQNAQCTREIFLDNKYNPDADITLYLKAKFSAIRLRYEGIPHTWASEEVIRFLVQEASGQFVYAATVVRFVESTEGPPIEQLKRVLEWRRVDRSKPFAPLDLLYSRILQTSPDPIAAAKWTCAIEDSIDFLHSQFDDRQSHVHKNALFVRYFLEAYPGEMNYLLGGLTSLLRLPSKDNGHQSFHFYHKSLFDFIKDPNRSEEFGLHVSPEMRTLFLGTRVVAVLKNRGPQVHPENIKLGDWLFTYARSFWSLLDGQIPIRCSDDDVDWWASILEVSPHKATADRHAITATMGIFILVHEKCKWYSCSTACRVWRRGIIRNCNHSFWRLPGTLEIVRDRFIKYRHYEQLPLRPKVNSLVPPSSGDILREGIGLDAKPPLTVPEVDEHNPS